MVEDLDKPVTRRECGLNHKEVDDLKVWVSKIDARIWALLIGIFLCFVGVGANLFITLSRVH